MWVKTKDAMVEADYVEKVNGQIVFFLRNRMVVSCGLLSSSTLNFMYSEILSWVSVGDVVNLTLFDSRNSSWIKRWFL